MIKLLLLTNQDLLISQIEEVGSDIGEPDCRLVNPFLVNGDTLQPWMNEYTHQNIFMIHSDKILTLADPKPTLLEKYQNLTK
jgi:hypothetical protein